MIRKQNAPGVARSGWRERCCHATVPACWTLTYELTFWLAHTVHSLPCSCLMTPLGLPCPAAPLPMTPLRCPRSRPLPTVRFCSWEHVACCACCALPAAYGQHPACPPSISCSPGTNKIKRHSFHMSWPPCKRRCGGGLCHQCVVQANQPLHLHRPVPILPRSPQQAAGRQQQQHQRFQNYNRQPPGSGPPSHWPPALCACDPPHHSHQQ